jgi:hypothetical protein
MPLSMEELPIYSDPSTRGESSPLTPSAELPKEHCEHLKSWIGGAEKYPPCVPRLHTSEGDEIGNREIKY